MEERNGDEVMHICYKCLGEFEKEDLEIRGNSYKTFCYICIEEYEQYFD